MPTYTANFFTEADWAETDIKAASPKQALRRARQIESDQSEILDFQSYDSTGGVEHIEIRASDGTTVAEWQHDDLRLRLARCDLIRGPRSPDRGSASRNRRMGQGRSCRGRPHTGRLHPCGTRCHRQGEAGGGVTRFPFRRLRPCRRR